MSDDQAEPQEIEAELVEDDDDEACDCDRSREDRRWLESIGSVLAAELPDENHSDRVAFALDRLKIAACERGVRILSADLPAPE